MTPLHRELVADGAAVAAGVMAFTLIPPAWSWLRSKLRR